VKLGISSYTFGWSVGVPGHKPARPLDEQGLLDKCREHGVKILQIGDNLPLHTFDDARLERLAARAGKDGVQLEVGARGLTAKRLAEYAAIASRLNAKLIRFVIDEGEYRPTAEQIVDVLLQSKSMLNGVVLGIENHDRFRAETLRQIVQSAGSEQIGICLDTANSLGAGEGLETVLAILLPFTVNLHIKDFQVDRVPHLMGFVVSGRPAGAGFLDVPSLLKQLAPFDRCHTAILELWTPPEARLEETISKEAAWAGQSLQYLKSFFS
jgi:sugar phosphate isomerase/epimerase